MVKVMCGVVYIFMSWGRASAKIPGVIALGIVGNFDPLEGLKLGSQISGSLKEILSM